MDVKHHVYELLPTNSSKWCRVTGVYHDIMTCSQQKLMIFPPSVRYMTIHFPLSFLLGWWYEMRYEIYFSHFYSGGLGDVLKWCNVRAHKSCFLLLLKIPLTSVLPLRTNPHQLTCGSNFWPLFTLCVIILFAHKRESIVVSSEVRAETRETNICSQSVECS